LGFRIKGRNGIHKERISLIYHLHECSCSHEQKPRMIGSLVTPNVSFTLEFLHALTIFHYVFMCIIMFKIQHACWKASYFGVVLFIDSK
jgi:hypothetical protein